MTLFSKATRTHLDEADHVEDPYSFLNRSARAASGRVRVLLESWFAHIPEPYKMELAQRCRSDFNAVFFELLVHEFLLRTEHEVEIHPLIPSNDGDRPDFRAVDRAGRSTYIEATVITGQSDEDRANAKILATLYDQITELNIPDYFLDIVSINNPNKKQPSGKRIKQFILQYVESLDYERLTTINESGAIIDLPGWTYREDGLDFEFRVIPRSRENRDGRRHRPIGAYPGSHRWGGSEGLIQSKLSKKASKYGELNNPYVLAVNCLDDWGSLEEDGIRALFGSKDPRFSTSAGELRVNESAGGSWIRSTGPCNSRLSGVLLTRVWPWNVGKAGGVLFLNPWAAHPYNGTLGDYQHIVLSGDKLNRVPGKSFGQFFSLTYDWPGVLFDDDTL